jgi:cytochrome P450
LIQGTIPFDVYELHRTYGDVVRIAPDHLAFADPQAWKDIMGHHSGPEMEKYERYYSPIAGTPVTLINAPRDYHSRMRKALAHGFSEKRIREQEDIIKKYIDLLMEKLTDASTAGSVALDMTAWYNFALFDVIGDLTFGEP